METVHTVEWMKQIAQQARAADRPTALVPTMGALHEGHFSLVRAARAQASPVVVSIFVNPRQFAPSEDLSEYPRTLEADLAALTTLGVDYVFAPTPEEMYPAGFRTSVTVEEWSEQLEGRSRPGHFRGVTTVVLKLFALVQPRFAFFGRKDAQQARLIRQMAADLNLDTAVILGSIVREPDGLAMSSRNRYLSFDERRAATSLFRALDAARREIAAGERDAMRLIGLMRRIFDGEKLMTLDYVEIADAETLEPVRVLRRSCLLLVAAFAGKTRLIDNALIEENGRSFDVTL